MRQDLPAARFTVPAATFFLWVDFAAYLAPGEDAATVPQRECGVLAGPGPSFGGPANQARLSLSLKEDLMMTAMRRIGTGLARRQRPEPAR